MSPGSAPELEHERKHWEEGRRRVVGVDEAGIGSLCGPVIAAAVQIPPYCQVIAGVRDSKTLAASQRERLVEEIRRQAVAIGIGAASVAEIERLNVLRAAHLAMRRALARVEPYDFALIDGRYAAGLDPARHTAIVGGDAQSYAIACASIIAKTTRDRLLRRLAARYPHYGWERNVGYPTEEHLAALRRYGVTPHHRRAYAPIRALLAAATESTEARADLSSASVDR